jgi:hypothetical protein
MGVFTIYDWGNGAAAEAYNRMVDRFGPALAESVEYGRLSRCPCAGSCCVTAS